MTVSLPTLSGVGRLTEDPSLRFSQSGTAVCTVNLAFNSRRKNAAGDWEDGDSMFVRATAFKETAESMAESLTRGCEVFVSGRLKLDRWEDKNGDKRSAPSLLIDAIGPNLRYATAQVKKAERPDSYGGFGGGAKSSPADDPWGSAPPASGGFADDPPPF
jgi:single-strand DNA-binding protein